MRYVAIAGLAASLAFAAALTARADLRIVSKGCHEQATAFIGAVNKARKSGDWSGAYAPLLKLEEQCSLDEVDDIFADAKLTESEQAQIASK